jgi:hypothetical protein
MTPEVWGRHLWYSIHFIALDYPDAPTAEQMEQYQVFFENLGSVLPCYKCSQNYKRHLQEMPLTAHALASKDNLFAWTVALHNIVNKETGKAEWKIDQAKRFYMDPEFNKKVCTIQQHITVQQAAPGAAPSLENAATQSASHVTEYVLAGVIGVIVGIGIMVLWQYVKHNKKGILGRGLLK